MIKVENLSLTYPGGKGIFDVDFTLGKGEVAGYLGPNGAGKTTTIRALMGFMRATKGSCIIDGMDCFEKSPEIQRILGYIPGEIAFIEDMTGEEYLKFISDLRGITNHSRQKQLLEMFELSPKGSIRKFSKGMKQKLSIVAAFMHDPQVLILDEPTSGLDPLMQGRFVELILSEKAAGKTILMSSHIFEEVERTCDNVIIIKDGRIVAQSDIDTLKSSRRRAFVLRTAEGERAAKILTEAGFELGDSLGDTLEVYVTGENVDRFVKTLGQLTLLWLDTKSQTLEDVFMHYYAREGD